MGVKQASTESSSFTGGDEETTLWNDITTWAQKHSLFADEGVLIFHSIPTFGIRVVILLYSSKYKFNCCSFCSREAPFADQVNPKCSTRHMSNFSSIVRAFFFFFFMLWFYDPAHTCQAHCPTPSHSSSPRWRPSTFIKARPTPFPVAIRFSWKLPVYVGPVSCSL